MKHTPWLLFVIIPILVVCPRQLLGQEGSDGQTFLARQATSPDGNPLAGGFSLLDPSKFSMSHSYTMSYFSTGGRGNVVGLYMNTMNYQFSAPLAMTVHLGYLHQPFGGHTSTGQFSNSAVLSGFELTYRPKKNFFLKIEYGSVPVPSNFYHRYGSWYDW